jgi:hypothetical protein
MTTVRQVGQFGNYLTLSSGPNGPRLEG